MSLWRAHLNAAAALLVVPGVALTTALPATASLPTRAAPSTPRCMILPATIVGSAGTDTINGKGRLLPRRLAGSVEAEPKDPDVCDDTVETKRSCRKPAEISVPETYTGTSTGTVLSDWGNQNVLAECSASYTYELDVADEDTQFYMYKLTQYDVDWAASGTISAGSCTVDAPAVNFQAPCGSRTRSTTPLHP